MPISFSWRKKASEPQEGARRVGPFRRFFTVDRWVGLGLLVAFLALSVSDPYPVEFARERTFDLYQKLSPRQVTQRPVAIVDIDEKSLNEIGQWPWPRTVVAQIVANLFNQGAALVAFDVVFAEPDRLNPGEVAKSLHGVDAETEAKLKAMPSNDALLADLITQTRIPVQVGKKIVQLGRVVLGQAVYFDASARDNAEDNPPKSLSVAAKGLRKGAPPPQEFLPSFVSMVRNIPVLEDAAGGHGLFSLLPEPDNVVRRVPTFLVKGDNFYPSLPVEMLRLAMGQTTSMVTTDLDGVQDVRIRKPGGGFFRISTDSQGRIRPHFSERDAEKYVSAVDVLNGSVDPAKVAGKMILVGTSATGLLDIRATPVDPILPGVEVHAQVVEAVMTNQLLNRPQAMKLWELLFLGVVGVFMIAVLPWVGARWSMGIFLITAGGMATTSWMLFVNNAQLLDATFPVAAVLVIFTIMTYIGYSREAAQKQQIRDAFGHYLSPDMVERLAEDPAQLKLGGDKRELTMLFCDVRGFTTISETFKAFPEGLTRLMNKLLTPLTGVIMERHGTVDKYMGDCIMAFWNAPLDDLEHPRNACRSALAMLAEMAPLNERLKQEAEAEGRKHLDLRIGVGINSGDVVVGNMGSDQRFDYSVLGDAVNLASRLEGQCKTYAVDCVIGETTKAQVEDFAVLELDQIKVKGKLEAVAVFALLGDEAVATTEPFKALKAAHESMLTTYRAQDWDGAVAALASCRERMGEFNLVGLYDLYEERIRVYKENPPGHDWDGVFVATSK